MQARRYRGAVQSRFKMAIEVELLLLRPISPPVFQQLKRLDHSALCDLDRGGTCPLIMTLLAAVGVANANVEGASYFHGLSRTLC
jgi:hypothetical protein